MGLFMANYNNGKRCWRSLMSSDEDSQQRLAHVGCAWMMFCFSLYAIIGRFSAEGDPPMFKPAIFILLRQTIAGIVLLIITRIFEGPIRIERSDLPRIFVCGVIGISGSQLFFLYGERFTTATNAVCVEPLIPVIAGVLAFFVGLESFGEPGTSERWSKLGGVAVAATGAVITGELAVLSC